MEELKTRSELMAELEKDAEVIRKHFENECNVVKIDERGEYLSFFLKSTVVANEIWGRTFKYRPDQVAPADGRAVIVWDGDKLMHRVSKGVLNANGSLQVYHNTQCTLTADWYYWCDYLNRDHHSPGWRKEWEPKK